MMKTFKSFMKEQAIDELMIETSLLDVQLLFSEIKLEPIADATDGQRFKLTATTRKGTKIQNELGISELLSIGYIKNLIQVSYK